MLKHYNTSLNQQWRGVIAKRVLQENLVIECANWHIKIGIHQNIMQNDLEYKSVYRNPQISYSFPDVGKITNLEPQDSTRCEVYATEAECSFGRYPNPSYKYAGSGSWSNAPAGCYVYTSASSRHHNEVYFNRGGTTCQSDKNCLCKKKAGKYHFCQFYSHNDHVVVCTNWYIIVANFHSKNLDRGPSH